MKKLFMFSILMIFMAGLVSATNFSVNNTWWVDYTDRSTEAEALVDMSPSSITGVNTGAVFSSAGFTFVKSEADQIAYGTSNLIGTGTNPVTVNIWLNHTDAVLAFNDYYRYTSARQSTQLLTGLNNHSNGEMRLFVGFRSGSQGVSVDVINLFANWTNVDTMLTFVYDGGTKTSSSSFDIYIDGVLFTTGKAAFSAGSAQTYNGLAQESLFDGVVKTASFYNNTAFNATQVLELFNNCVNFNPYNLSDGCPGIAPAMVNSTWNMTSATANFTAHRTNQSFPIPTENPEPSLEVDTDIAANCRIGVTNSNWTDMNSSRDCSTTGGINQVCTLGAFEAFSGSGFKTLYVACTNLDNITMSALSTSGALNVSFNVPPAVTTPVWTSTGGFSSGARIYGQIIDNITAVCTNSDGNELWGCNITITDPDGVLIANNVAMTNTSGNDTNITVLYDTNFELNKAGNWSINLTAWDNSSSTAINSTIIEVATSNFTVSTNHYGFTTGGIPTEQQLADYITNYTYNLVEITDNITTISINWPTTLSRFNTSYNSNLVGGLNIILDTDCSDQANVSAYIANITNDWPDLLTGSYQSAIIYLSLEFLNNSYTAIEADDCFNNISKAIVAATNNQFIVYARGYNSSGLDTSYIEPTTMRYNEETTGAALINWEAATTRNTTYLNRIYNVNSQSVTLLDIAELLQTRAYKILRTGINSSTTIVNTSLAQLTNADVLVFNNGSTNWVNTTVQIKSGSGKDVYDYTNKDILEIDTDLTFNVSVFNLSVTYLMLDDLDHYQLTSNTQGTLYKATTSGWSNFSWDDGSRDGASQVTTLTRRLFYLYDGKFTTDNIFQVYYGWLNVSYPQNWSMYDFIIIADQNDAEIDLIVNQTCVLGYIGVFDYNESNATWVSEKQAEIDVWLAFNSNMCGIFANGLDTATINNATDFEIKFKQIIDHIRITKGKLAYLNTYTYNEEYCTWGDACMKESCVRRWNGTNASNPDSYSWEDWDLELEKSTYFHSHNIEVICQGFDNRTAAQPYQVYNYTQMINAYYASKVLGYNYWSWNQPDFQYASDIYVPDVGTDMSNSWQTDDNETYCRLYSNGEICYNKTSHEGWQDDGRVFANVTLYANLHDDATPQTYDILISDGDNGEYNYTVTTAGSGWAYNTYAISMNTSTQFSNGRYRIEVAGSTAIAFLGFDSSGSTWQGFRSWFSVDSGSTWTTETENTFYMFTLGINDSRQASLDSGIEIVNQTETTEYYRYNISLIGVHDFTLETWSYQAIVELGTFNNLTYWNGTAYNRLYPMNTDTCDTDNPVWNSTTVNGEIFQSCYEVSGVNYTFRITSPHMSQQDFVVFGEGPQNISQLFVTPTNPRFNQNLDVTFNVNSSDPTDTLDVTVTWYNSTDNSTWINVATYDTTFSNVTHNTNYTTSNGQGRVTENLTNYTYWKAGVTIYNQLTYLYANSSSVPVFPLENLTVYGEANFTESNQQLNATFSVIDYDGGIWCGLNLYNASMVFTEVANSPTSTIGAWQNLTNVYDGDWNTYGYGATLAGMYFDYNKLNNSLREGSIWRVKDGDNDTNLTIPAACWDADEDVLSLRVSSDPTFGANQAIWYCDNGPAWTILRIVSGVGTDDIYGQAMYFYATNATSSNDSVVNGTNTSLFTTLTSDGAYEWNIDCNATGNPYPLHSEHYVFRYDTTGPWYSDNTTNANSTYPQIDDVIQLNVTIHDMFTFANCTLQMNDNGTWYNSTVNTYGAVENQTVDNHTFTVRPISTANNSNVGWRTVCSDLAGNYNTSDVYNFTVVDTTLPNFSNGTSGNNWYPNLTKQFGSLPAGNVQLITDSGVAHGIINVNRHNLTMNFTYYDYNLFQVEELVICDINGTIYNYTMFDYNNTNLTVTSNVSLQGMTFQKCSINISASDDHTIEEIPKYKVYTVNNGLEFETENDNIIRVQLTQDKEKDKPFFGHTILDKVKTKKQIDRYNFEFEFDEPVKQVTFTITANNKIYPRVDSKYSGHFVVWNEELKRGNWIDFNELEITANKYKIKKINDYEYEVTIKLDNPKKTFMFESIGGTNVYNASYLFYIGGEVNISSNNVYDNVSFADWNITVITLDSYPGWNGSAVINDTWVILENISNGTYQLDFSHFCFFSQSQVLNVTNLTQNLTWNSYESVYNVRIRNIATGVFLDGWNISFYNYASGGWNNYTNVTAAGLQNFTFNATTYNMTIVRATYDDYSVNLTLSCQENTTAIIDMNFLAQFYLFDEATLGVFNISGTDSVRFLLFCPDATYTTLINTTSPIIPITCDYIKFKFVIDYTTNAGETYYRTLILDPDDAFEVDIYLIDMITTDWIYNSFIIDDLLEDYTNPSIYIKKIINDETPQILADYIDIEDKVGAYLIENHEYIIEIHSDNNAVRVLGFYSADIGGEKTLRLYNIEINPNGIGFVNNVQYYAGIVNRSGSGGTEYYAFAKYFDAANITNNVTWTLYSGTYNGTLVYQIVSTGMDIEFEYNITDEYNANVTLYSDMFIARSEHRFVKLLREFSEIQLDIMEHLSTDFVNWFFILLLGTIAIMGTIRTANMLSLILVGFASLFVLFGWFGLSSSILALAALIALFSVLKKGDKNMSRE